MPPFTSGPRGVSSTSILASAAAAEVVAVAARRSSKDSNFIKRCRTAATIGANGTTETAEAFLPVPSSSLNLVLKAGGSNPNFVYNIAGTDYPLTADTAALTLSSSTGFYRISINAAGTLATESKWPVYSKTAPSAPSANDLWFDLISVQMYKYSGSAWVAYDVIMVGLAYVSSSVISDVANMPINVTPSTIRRECGAGTDGELVTTGATVTTLTGIKQYSIVATDGTSTVTHTAATISFVPILLSQGPRMHCGTSGIDLKGKGIAQRAGQTGAGVGGTGNAFGGQGGAGGGGTNAGANGSTNWDTSIMTARAAGAVGGTAGNAATGTAADTNYTQPHARYRGLFIGFGAGGSTGGGSGAANGGSGGASGGFLHAVAVVVYIGASAFQRADGSNGGDGAGANCGGGGGGGGGNVLDEAFSFQQQTGYVCTSTGGTKGAAGGAGAGAGTDGGAGRWHQERIAA